MKLLVNVTNRFNLLNNIQSSNYKHAEFCYIKINYHKIGIFFSSISVLICSMLIIHQFPDERK